MTTINRTVETEYDRTMAARLIENRPFPFTLTLTDGKHRTTAQNRLQRLWMNEIAEQKGDMTPEEVRAYCKLVIGVPILRNENEAFRARYDQVVKPLSYEQKLSIMAEPLSLPVTSLMTTKQKTEYLDGIVKHFAEQGIVLTMPDELREANQEPSSATPSDEVGADNPSPQESTVGPAPSSNDDKANLTALIKRLHAAVGPDETVIVNTALSYSADGRRLSDSAADKAKSIVKRFREVCRGELELDDAIELVCGIAGIEPSELEEA